MIEVINPKFRHCKMKCLHCGCTLRFHFGDVETIRPFGDTIVMELISCPECHEKTCIEFTRKGQSAKTYYTWLEEYKENK
jgi:hypothetical protein